MTKYVINIESKETFDWIKHTFEGFEKKAKLDPSRWSGIVEHLSNVTSAINEAENAQTLQKEATKSKDSTTKDQYLPNLCPDHPSYTAIKPPRIDCKGHWAAYKKMNPMSYEAARRNYDRSKTRKK